MGLKLNQRGFTLLELIIAMTLLAAIVGIMTAALSMAYKTVEKGEQKVSTLERKKIVLPLIESQIESAFSSEYTDQGEKKSRFTGENDSVTFASNYSIWRGTSGNALVKYYVKRTDQGRCVLHVEETILGTSAGNEAGLTKDYEAITFQYYLKNSLEEGKWLDRWPSDEKSMPRKIRICFAEGVKKKMLTAIPLIATNTINDASFAQPATK